jgi:hypothetical protein
VIRFLARWRHRRYEHLDERVAEARRGAQQAAEEVARSDARRELIHEDVVKPRQRVAAHNQFADMIRETLANDRHRGNA